MNSFPRVTVSASGNAGSFSMLFQTLFFPIGRDVPLDFFSQASSRCFRTLLHFKSFSDSLSSVDWYKVPYSFLFPTSRRLLWEIQNWLIGISFQVHVIDFDISWSFAKRYMFKQKICCLFFDIISFALLINMLRSLLPLLYTLTKTDYLKVLSNWEGLNRIWELLYWNNNLEHSKI